MQGSKAQFAPVETRRATSLLTSAYLAPVQYYELLANRTIQIESHEHYIKQTYRNRCHIATANGVMPLIIPIEKPDGKCITQDVKISSHENWQELHLRAMEAAYNSSPFFEYYKDDFLPFYQKKWKYLFDFNVDIQDMILDLLDIDTDVSFTGEYEAQLPDDITDLRNFLSPKQENNYKGREYSQVFQERFGFLPNLSIVDLLFKMGPEAVLFLNKN
jgi:hypothetical protein